MMDARRAVDDRLAELEKNQRDLADRILLLEAELGHAMSLADM
jgi:hypothetical protein